ncbi:MAG: carbamoyl phosphate synthase small subunit [Candidatus Omnitrophota bacterium]|nr:MAG: carbamoyl phosphate synthase small subunit [Candidatus Omnitrophota bacterium]
MRAVLVLEDGRVFPGRGLGVEGERIGELFFNTAVVGYQEMLTDPANAGKILVLTYPLIGNYGCAAKFNESKQAWPFGFVIKENSRIYSNWQAKESLADFVKKQKILTIQGVDTRTLAVHLRQKGQMLGVVSTLNFEPKGLIEKIKAFRKNQSASFLPAISAHKPEHLTKRRSGAKKIGILDLGITKSIIRQLEALGLAIIVLPYNFPPKEILRLKLHGLIVSSGPEEDPGLREVVENVGDLIAKMPMLGISTGHQVISRALGGKLAKMKLGHHGVNLPIYNPASYKGAITVQNHSWVVDADSLAKIKNIKITAYNLNDRSIEEIESKKLKIIGTQYIPASPGFNEINSTLKNFVKYLKRSS